MWRHTLMSARRECPARARAFLEGETHPGAREDLLVSDHHVSERAHESWARTRAPFVADLWFVFALLTPLYLPLFLCYLLPLQASTGPLAPWMSALEALLTGSLPPLRAALQTQGTFAALVALPTGSVALNALALRLAARGDRVGIVGAALTLVVRLASLGVLLWLLGAPQAWMGFGAGVALHVGALLLLSHRRLAMRYGFELILGVILMDHLGLGVMSLLAG